MWRPWSICGAGSPVARILGSESQGVVVAGLSLFTLSPGDTLKPWVLGRDVLFYGKNSPRGHSKGTELKLRLLPAHFELLILMRQQTKKKENGYISRDKESGYQERCNSIYLTWVERNSGHFLGISWCLHISEGW